MESLRFLEDDITISNKLYEDMGNSSKEGCLYNRDLDTFKEIRLFNCLDMKCFELIPAFGGFAIILWFVLQQLNPTDFLFINVAAGRCCCCCCCC